MAPVPFQRLRFADVAAAYGYLAGFRGDLAFLRALGEQMRLATGMAPMEPPYPARLIGAAARAAASRQLLVAAEFLDGITIVFDEVRPSHRLGDDTVVFPDRPGVAAYLTGLLEDAGNAEAFGAALRHPAGLRYLGAAADAILPPDRAGMLGRVLPLLQKQQLILQPDGESGRHFRLRWADPPALVVAQPEAAPAPAPPPPRRLPIAPRAAPPVSRLPDPPAFLSPQAQTLIDAAKSGVPFCEECARHAAEMEDA